MVQFFLERKLDNRLDNRLDFSEKCAMLEEDKEIVCQDCGLRYQVIWSNDGDEPPCNYCPRCGSQELEESK